ncbi:hypothetical protein K525DRAFT_246321 [Schizophyllum commune Loenen D]|nr:hypothetical protein K525DRAFT_246321 [Schizophyllum commune Loenen D]
MRSGSWDKIVCILTSLTKGLVDETSKIAPVLLPGNITYGPPVLPSSDPGSVPTTPTTFAVRKSVTKMRPVRPRVFDGQIQLSDVLFASPARSEVASVRDVNISLLAGDPPFVVGDSGAGKSTIAQLVSGVYDNYSGIIWIDDRDVRYIDQDQLRSNIACVHRVEGVVLEGNTMRENTWMGTGYNLHIEVSKSRPPVLDIPSRVLVFRPSHAGVYLTLRPPMHTATHKARTTNVVTQDLLHIERKDFVYVLRNGRMPEQGFSKDLEVHSIFTEVRDSRLVVDEFYGEFLRLRGLFSLPVILSPGLRIPPVPSPTFVKPTHRMSGEVILDEDEKRPIESASSALRSPARPDRRKRTTGSVAIRVEGTEMASDESAASRTPGLFAILGAVYLPLFVFVFSPVYRQRCHDSSLLLPLAPYVRRLTDSTDVSDNNYVGGLVLGATRLDGLLFDTKYFVMATLAGVWADRMSAIVFASALTQDQAWFDRAVNTVSHIVQVLVKAAKLRTVLGQSDAASLSGAAEAADTALALAQL